MAPRPCLHLHLQTCYPFSLISAPPLRFVIKKNRETSQSPEYLTQLSRFNSDGGQGARPSIAVVVEATDGGGEAFSEVTTMASPRASASLDSRLTRHGPR